MLRSILRLVAVSFAFSIPAYSQSFTTVGPAERPAMFKPAHLDQPKKKAPLLLVLHGYGMNAASIDQLLSASAGAAALNAHLLIPEGRQDPRGQRFWDATDACCDFFSPQLGKSDEQYLMGLVKEVQETYRVKKNEIYVVGFSNGGFMAHRLACNHSDVFAGFASLAGANYADPQQCQPEKPISALQIHGTVDPVISYQGGFLRAPYPSAAQSAAFWADHNDCQEELSTQGAFELSLFNADLSIAIPSPENLFLYFSPGPETDSIEYSSCRADRRVGLWTMNGLGHAPIYQPDLVPRIINFLRKP